MITKEKVVEQKVLRIVIADDEGVIRMGLKTMLTALGYQVIGTASDGDDALEKIRALQPDLVLLDIKMPGKDGLAVAEIVAQEMPLPIIMLTAFTERSLIDRALNAAVMGYLVKPISEGKLRPAIEIALERFGEMQETAQEAYQLRGQLLSREIIDAAKRILVATGPHRKGSLPPLTDDCSRKTTLHEGGRRGGD